MLSRLSISNLATIQSLSLEFGRGFTVLTGETGAGKSILIDAIRLALGGRAFPELTRTGASQTVVEAVFDLERLPEVRERLEAIGVPVSRELVIRRTLQESGRGRTVANDCTVSLASLESIAAYLVSIHGQHDNQMLLQPGSHIDFLDQYGGLLALRGEVAALHARYTALAREQRAATEQAGQREARRRELALTVEEIEAAAPQAAEDEALRREHSILSHAERLIQTAETVSELLYDGQEAVHSRLGRVEQLLGEGAGIDPALSDLLDQVRPLRFQAEDLYRAVGSYRGRLEADPARLDWINERLAVLEKLVRRHGGSLDAVLRTLKESQAELEALELAQSSGQNLERNMNEVAGRLHRKAQRLSARRKAEAEKLDREVHSQLGQLGMDKAIFETRVTPARSAGGSVPAYTALGGDEVEFLLSTNPGQALRPLSKIASGGELSRIMLALKSVLAKADPTSTLVFDEVDAGISGAMAEIVGRKLRGLGESHQVLCVTHLPQIAALATQHVLVSKRMEAAETFTRAEPLSDADKVREIARLLSGIDLSDHSLRSAEEMVQRGQRSPL